jgi:class 3 adenylate cyclase
VPICPSCGQENPAGFRFCGACGADLGAERTAEVRRTVTILFCDLVGSTALGERSDPEVLRGLMRRYHHELRTILERHGGTVEKFVGDAVMAVFGIPHVHEDDARRAVRAGDEIRRAVEPFGLEIRMGINTGEVVAGEGETLVTGDAVNVAARLEQVAARGEILLGDATHALVRDSVSAEATEPLVLKGKAQPVAAHRLLELLADAPVPAPAAPFVGRKRELAALEQTLERAAATRVPQLCTIVGPPGIGKSRLVRELVGRSNARVVAGRCLSYGEGITYWPLAEVVSQIGSVREALGDTGDADLAASRVDAALGVADGGASSEEIAWAFRKLFERLASDEPLIVVLDDIHWAEPTLLDLIEYVSTFAHDVPLVVLCSARPDLLEVRAAWAAPSANSSLLILDPLGDDEAEALVDELRNLPSPTRARIVDAAEGNPLFVEQLVAMQAESDAIEIPPTIQALLGARIDRLEREERAVLECGSIEGRVFHVGAVRALLPERSRPRVGAHLLTLVRKDFIRPAHTHLPGDDAFRFGHALIRDAAYASMPKRVRAELHERYARWLESRLPEDPPDELLGYHLEQAHRYTSELDGPSEQLTNLARSAGPALASAARRAAARGDAPAAANLLERAVALLEPDSGARLDALLDLVTALFDAGDLTRATETADAAVDAARSRGDRRRELHALIKRESLVVQADPEGSGASIATVADEAIRGFEELGDDLGLARAWQLRSQLGLMRCRFGESASALERALDHLRRSGDPATEKELTWQLAGMWTAGEMPADELRRRLHAILEAAADDWTAEAKLLVWVALAEAYGGDVDGARELIGRREARLAEYGLTWALAFNRHVSAQIGFLARDAAAAERAWRESCELYIQMGERGSLSGRAAELAQKALYAQGKHDEVERFARLAADAAASDDIETHARWRGALAKVLAHRGDDVAAEALAREAAALVEPTDCLSLQGDVLSDSAEVLRILGRPDEARAALETALAVYERKGIVPEIERTRARLAGAAA